MSFPERYIIINILLTFKFFKSWEKLQKKIYCCDRGDNDNVIAAILAGNNRKDDWSPIAAMMGGGTC